MHRFICYLGLFLLMGNVEGSNLLLDFYDANRNFTIGFYKAVKDQNPNVNFLISPVAAQVSMGLAHFGATGNAAEELLPYLEKITNKNLKRLFSMVTSKFKPKFGYKFELVNTLFVAKKIRIKKAYRKLAKNKFGSPIRSVNFEKVGHALDSINSWVQTRTGNKVKKMLTDADINQKTTALLLDALFFQGYWLRQFDPKNTQRLTFYKDCEETAPVDMMVSKDTFNYYVDNELDAQFLEIPFKGNTVTMTIVLPRTKFGLHNLEARIADVLVPRDFEKDLVEVMIPKFRVEFNVDLKLTLLAVNVHTPFQCTANFSGISKSAPRLFLNQAVQKTYLELDEKGATSTKKFAPRDTASFRQKSQSFVANYPFLYYFTLKSTGIFFIGRYLFPEE